MQLNQSPIPDRTARLPFTLQLLLSPVLILTFIYARAGQLIWILEVGPALLGFLFLALSSQSLPLSDFCYICVFLHKLVLIYGGYYTYAETPLGNWAMEAFHFSRNHYDRVGHLAFGFFPVFIVKEVLLRVTPLRRGGWFYFLVLSDILAAAAFYEFIEWWSTFLVAPTVGVAFLGSQDDPWDTLWDMFLAFIGATAVLLFLGRLHDRSMEKMFEGQ